MVLTVSDLSCHRSTSLVLEGVNFSAEAGETVVLRGPNGAGKSTLLRVLSGLLPMSSGEVRLNGISLQNDPDSYIENTAFAGHADAIKSQLTVSENLHFWAALFGSGSPDHAMNAFGLATIADRPAYACSAGQKRRLGLSRLALVSRKLWLLDEPTISLDAAAVASLMELIAEHCESGGLAVIATHVELDLENIRTMDLQQGIAQVRQTRTDQFLQDLVI